MPESSGDENILDADQPEKIAWLMETIDKLCDEHERFKGALEQIARGDLRQSPWPTLARRALRPEQPWDEYVNKEEN